MCNLMVCLDLIFDHAIVALNLVWTNFRICKVLEIDAWMGHWLGSVGNAK